MKKWSNPLLLLHSDFNLSLGGDDVDEFAEALVFPRCAQAPQFGFARCDSAIAHGGASKPMVAVESFEPLSIGRAMYKFSFNRLSAGKHARKFA